jgi:hypothetical protein
VTLFIRSRHAPGAGKPSVKAAFTVAAHKTLGVAVRAERNAIVASGVRGTGDGIYRRKSRAKETSPLFGTVKEIHTRR